MPPKSMTGFGKCRVEEGSVRIEVELRSVNHRFLDITCKLPQVYAEYEQNLVNSISQRLSRGRIDLLVVRTPIAAPLYEVRVNERTFQSYWESVSKVLESVGVRSRDARASAALHILGRREVVELLPQEVDSSSEYEHLIQGIKSALDELVDMRTREGECLHNAVLGYLEEFEHVVQRIADCADLLPKSYHERLSAKLKNLELQIEIEPARLAQEVAILADRVDISEELTRLRSHSEQFRHILEGIEVGRKLEFLIQELNREINTCSAKSQNSEIQGLVVEGKALLEKMREQAANIE